MEKYGDTGRYTMINKKWFSEEDNWIERFSQYGFTIMVLLLKRKTVRNEVIFSMEYIMKSLGVKSTNANRNKIINTLKKFENSKLLEYDVNIENINDTDDITGDILEKLGADFKQGNFVIINDKELNAILSCDSGIHKDKLLTLFAFIKGCINSETKVCQLSFDCLRDNTKIVHDLTIETYIKILKELGLLLYGNAATLYNEETGAVRECANIYALNTEGGAEALKDAIEKDLKEKSKLYKTTKKSKKSDKKRSDTLKAKRATKKAVHEGDSKL